MPRSEQSLFVRARITWCSAMINHAAELEEYAIYSDLLGFEGISDPAEIYHAAVNT